VRRPPPHPQTWLAFVCDGTLTRDQAILKLGEPTGRFEQDRILTWLISADKDGTVSPVQRTVVPDTLTLNCGHAQFSLVMVFSGDVLQRHSIVPLNFWISQEPCRTSGKS
jgi:hypothetical protein